MTFMPVSPNTVLANALTHAEDVLAPRILAAPPEKLVLVVGTQINGAPHIGTSLVQSLAFALAARLRNRFGLRAEVRFGALDNAPYDLTTDPATGHRYQRAYAQSLGRVRKVSSFARSAGPAASWGSPLLERSRELGGACSRRAGRRPSYWMYLGLRPVQRECVPGVAGLGAPPGRRLGERLSGHDLGEQALAALVDGLYGPLLAMLSQRTGISFRVETYTQQQAGEHFRRTWLRLLPRIDAARWWLAPSTGTPHVRVPCPSPGCGWAEKHAERTQVRLATPDAALVNAVCLHHGPYEARITPTEGPYVDLATLYRNLVKELALVGPPHNALHVMIKGGDWVFGSHLVDEAHQAVGLTRAQLPARLFCPQVVTDTGAKLSKSLIREGRAPLPDGAVDWMLDTRQWPGSLPEYADRLLALTETLLADPRHFFRSYSAAEIGRMMSAPATRSTPAP